MNIADTPLEESFFTAGDNLAAAITTQFDLVPTTVEDRRRRLKALAITGAILLVALILLGLVLPGQPVTSPTPVQADQSATL